MKRLNCPLNGLRNINEFTYGGEYHPMPDPQDADQRTWAEYLYFEDNKAGNVLEWWCHTASSYWFLVERNTIADQVVRTLSWQQFKDQQAFAERSDGKG